MHDWKEKKNEKSVHFFILQQYYFTNILSVSVINIDMASMVRINM
jgi:hypothetical protein